MTERVNLVDAYDNRSVVSKLVNMEERISGAETSVEASAEAAASSASKAAVSQTAAKTSEANAKASADAAAATLSNTVDLSSKQTITGAKTFAGDTTVTGQLISSGTNTLSGTTELEGTVELDSTAVATLNGKVTASNTGNSLKVANHDTVLTSNDVLSAKDINTPNGDANNLLHRSGNEPTSGIKEGSFVPIKIATGPTATINGWWKWLTINKQATVPDLIEITSPRGYSQNNGMIYGVALFAGAPNRAVSVINAYEWKTNIIVVSLKNGGNWEIWCKTQRYMNYIEMSSRYGSLDVTVNTDYTGQDALPTDATDIIYLLGTVE